MKGDKRKMSKTMRIYDDTHNLLREIATMEGCWMVTIIDKAVNMYKKTMFKKRNW